MPARSFYCRAGARRAHGNLKSFALIIILLSAGLGIRAKTLSKVGRSAVLAILLTAPLGTILIRRLSPVLLEAPRGES